MNTAVAERINPVAEARQQLDAMKGQFEAALPAHIPAERFGRVVMTAVQNNPDLLTKCSRQSLWNSCMKAAQDGLLPDGREGAIVQYGSAAQWMPMIAGLRKKVRNSGEIATWDVYVVHQNDKFEFRLGDEPFIAHEPTLEDPGSVIAAYSIAVLKSGERTREVMSVAAIEKVRARSKAKNNGPWVTDYEEMCRKTVARRHFKVLPASTDLDDLMRRDDDLYDMEGAKEEAQADRPKSLAGRLDALASLPTADGPTIDHRAAEKAKEAGPAGNAAQGSDGSADVDLETDEYDQETGELTETGKDDAVTGSAVADPTDAASYATFAKWKIAHARDPDELRVWFTSEEEKKRRADFKVTKEVFDALQSNAKAKITQLRTGQAA